MVKMNDGSSKLSITRGFDKKVFELDTRQAQRLGLSGGRKVKIYDMASSSHYVSR
ncbi:hypothetical protein BYT27DRAFT_7254832 [Phlegmacium glaucopus]|nr:hypothetical protein BYT27DRAFT_7254832 [Phlegmacium glaucopus]